MVDRSKRQKWTGHVPEDAERERLAATLGVLLRSMRVERDLSTRKLAARSTVARSTIQRLEAGLRRPRRSILATIAYGLDPGRAEQLAAALCEAASCSLRDDTAGGLRRRERRLADARRAVKWEAWRIWRDAESAKQEAFRLNTRVLARVHIGPLKPNMTAAEFDQEVVTLAKLEHIADTSDRLWNYRDALMAGLSRPRHPLEVNILDWHTAAWRARGGA